MTEQKFTPGPWYVKPPNKSGSYCVGARNMPLPANDAYDYYNNVASMTDRDNHPVYGGGISLETAEANAHLIAAAPELLEALKNLMDFIAWDEEYYPEAIAARKAIKKAEGGAA